MCNIILDPVYFNICNFTREKYSEIKLSFHRRAQYSDSVEIIIIYRRINLSP